MKLKNAIWFFGDTAKQVSVVASENTVEEMPVVDYSHLVVIIIIGPCTIFMK